MAGQDCYDLEGDCWLGTGGALGDAAGVLAAAVKGGTFEALTAASAAFTGAAAMWGYTNKSKA